VLARYWRDRGLFTLEEAVHRMTGLTARNFRIPHRGVLRVDHAADVVVFDPQRVADTATYDHPISPSVGIHAVYVNGVRAYGEKDSSTSRPRAGRLLRKSGDPS
jgi:N-acyl-D-amino-acid deacylase